MSDCDFTEEAAAVLSLIESDFGQSGRSVQYEAIRVELEYAYRRGLMAKAIAIIANALEARQGTDIGRVVYEAAAAATGCVQEWDSANQVKWRAAARGVLKWICNEQLENP